MGDAIKFTNDIVFFHLKYCNLATVYPVSFRALQMDSGPLFSWVCVDMVPVHFEWVEMDFSFNVDVRYSNRRDRETETETKNITSKKSFFKHLNATDQW